MNDINNAESHKQVGNKQSEKMEIVKQPHELMKDSSLKNTSDDVQRAIEGLKDIPDEELQEFLDDEDFMEGLDVVDAWEGDEDKNREIDHTPNAMEQEQKQISREHHRRKRKGSYSREKPKKEDKKQEENRRDPLKSIKDIERDKMRTKRDTESKLLAEKEKAIKHLLDSDNVVPPGTETEAIESITEKQNMERTQEHRHKSRERRRSMNRYGGKLSPPRRRTPNRFPLSPHRRRSPFMRSPERRGSPFRISVERHRSPVKYSPSKRRNSPRYASDRRSHIILSPDGRGSPRRHSWDRRSSVDRNVERHRRRPDMHERRRSRSRDRRSSSMERSRRRSSRLSGNRRHSPHSRARSRSVEKRARKRSPFINELARQLRNEAMMPTGVNNEYAPSTTMESAPPLLNLPVYQQETEAIPPPLLSSGYVPQAGPPPPSLSVLPTPNVLSSFVNFDPSMSFGPMNLHTIPAPDYSSNMDMYNQPNAVPIQGSPPPPPIRLPLLPAPLTSPQPVPAPVIDHGQIPYNPSYNMSTVQQSPSHQFEISSEAPNVPSITPSTSLQSYTEHRSATTYGFHASHEERLKTPEPPVISKPKQFKKTSLSSLLEASVSAKDPSNIPVLYPGFKPEIMRHCEQALCQLPLEDPRLRLKGRFFYDRDEEDTNNEFEDHMSNSILLQKNKSKICWEENAEQQTPIVKPANQTHQKICQTDELESETIGTQTNVTMIDFESQVYPHDLQQVHREEKRSVMDRLDWNVRETYEHPQKFRKVEDLRWSLSNSSQKRSWNRQTSPSRKPTEHEHHLDSIDHVHGNFQIDSFENRDNFSGHKIRDHFAHDKYSPDYRHSMERNDFHDRRSNHSRGESPMELEDTDDELMTEHTFQREPDWYEKGKILRGKGHILRGKHPGRKPYWNRGSIRGKF